MTEYVTTREIATTFRDMHAIVIPKGTRAVWIDGGQGGYCVPPGAVKLVSETANLFKHDATYYYIWVARADVEIEAD